MKVDSLDMLKAMRLVLAEATYGRSHCDVMGDRNFFAVADDVDQLGRATPEQVALSPAQVEGRRLRKKLRMLVTLPHLRNLSNLDDVASSIEALICSPFLRGHLLRTVLIGWEGRELSYDRLQAVANLLDDPAVPGGRSCAEVARLTGHHERTVAEVETFLGVAEVATDRLMDSAITACQAGLSARQFSAVSGVPRNRASRLVSEARDILDDCDAGVGA